MTVRGIICLAFIIAGIRSCNGSKTQGPLLWQIDDVVETSHGVVNYKKSIEPYLSTANTANRQPLLTIVEKDKTFAPDKHYYCNLSPYWWPDPKGGSAYINIDGKINPEFYEFTDKQKFEELSKNLKALSIAYFVTRDTSYLSTFTRQMHAWFIDTGTYMYPNIEYGQIAPGHYNNKGRSNAVIEAYCLNDILDGFRLLNSEKLIDDKTVSAFKEWLTLFLEWLVKSPQGKESYNGNANTSVMYDVLVCNIAEFVGNKDVFDNITNSFGEHRIKTQIMETGEQPMELKRTRSFSYSVFNLVHILDFCYIQESLGNHYYLQYEDYIDNAFQLLMSYIGREEEWPYQQITPIKQDENLLRQQYKRLVKLKELSGK